MMVVEPVKWMGLLTLATMMEVEALALEEVEMALS
jgi:hypothetical protein